MDALDTAALAIPLVAGPLAAWTVVKRGEQQRESKEEETQEQQATKRIAARKQKAISHAFLDPDSD